MMTYILVIVVYLTTGFPVANVFYVPEACTAAMAMEYTVGQIIPTLPMESEIQDPNTTMRWTCIQVPDGPGPGPAWRASFPGDRRA